MSSTDDWKRVPWSDNLSLEKKKSAGAIFSEYGGCSLVIGQKFVHNDAPMRRRIIVVQNLNIEFSFYKSSVFVKISLLSAE
jgi:hypothetical protein